MTITERLADHAVGLQYADIPAEVVARTKDLLVYHLAVALRGAGSPEAKLGQRFAASAGGANGRCSIIGQPDPTGLLEAVLANSLLVSRDSEDDVMVPPGINPGAAIWPVALAVGEAVGAKGEEFIAAVVVGYDVMARLHPPVWDMDLDVPRPVKWQVSPFGAAATAARLLGLSRQQTVWALGHAGQAGIGLFEGFPDLVVTGHGLAAGAGVLSAMLARADLPGSLTTVEGRYGLFESIFLQDVPHSVVASLATLGQEFLIMNAEIRRYPASIYNHAPIEFCERLVHDNGIRPEQVESLELVLPTIRASREALYDTVDNIGGPSNLMAMILVDGRVDPARMAPDEHVRAMRERVRLRFEAGRVPRYARVEITTQDDRRFVAEGDSFAPVPVDWSQWLCANNSPGFESTHVDRLIDLAAGLESVPEVGAVMACVRPGGAA